MSLIESATLRLEPLVAAHADEMFAPMSAAAIYAYIPEQPPVSVSALRQRYQQLERGHSASGRERWLNWIVRLGSGQCAGYVQATVHPGSTADFAFVFAPEHWGRGYGREAVRAVLLRAIQIKGLSRVIAETQAANQASCALLRGLGLIVERSLERFDAEQVIYATPAGWPPAEDVQVVDQ
jgi:RimJ/RimL family protein N-acetyltransferase